MDDEVRESKNRTIKEKGRETRLRHASMRPLVIELKLDLKCLNNAERDKLFLYFTECRWLCNYLIGLEADKFRDFGTETRSITSLDKDKNTVARELTMPAKFIQAVYSSLKQDMKALAAKRNKTGKRNGKLRSGHHTTPSSSTSIRIPTGMFRPGRERQGKIQEYGSYRGHKETDTHVRDGSDPGRSRIRQRQACEEAVGHIPDADVRCAEE